MQLVERQLADDAFPLDSDLLRDCVDSVREILVDGNNRERLRAASLVVALVNANRPKISLSAHQHNHTFAAEAETFEAKKQETADRIAAIQSQIQSGQTGSPAGGARAAGTGSS